MQIGVKRLAVLACAALVLAGCGSGGGTAESAEPSPGSKATASQEFDPLAFDEPEQPERPTGRPTRTEMLEGLRYVADAYSYGLRSGFQVIGLRAMGCGCSFVTDLERLSEEGLHAVMDPVDFEVLAYSPVKRVDKNTWSITARAQFVVPEAVIENAGGAEVRRQPAFTTVADVVLNVEGGPFGRWYFPWWQDTNASEA